MAKHQNNALESNDVKKEVSFFRENIRNITIYTIHISIVLLTAYLLALSNLVNYWYLLIIALPLLLSIAPTNFSKWSYTVNVRLFFPVSVGFFFVVLYHYFPTLVEVMSINPTQLNTNEQNAGNYGITKGLIEEQRSTGNFFEVNDLFKDAVTVLYAICVAFLLLKGLNDYDGLKEDLYAEANLVRTISDFATYFIQEPSSQDRNVDDPESNPEKALLSNIPAVQKLRKLMHEYLDNILILGDSRVATNPENERVLKDCIYAVGELNCIDQNDEIALQEIMRGIAELSNRRAKRMVSLEKRMSPFILLLVFLMSLTIVISFFGQATKEISIDYVYIFLLPTFYTSVFMTLIDLSSPFDGYWKIKLNAIFSVRERLETEIHEMERDTGQPETEFIPLGLDGVN